MIAGNRKRGHGSSWTVVPKEEETTWLLEHFSSPLFINNIVTPYWLAFCSSAHPITALPLINWLM
jgi:hypothetical protein